MKVLIVDDEMKVCQLIFHLVNWEEYGMDVIGMINDGENAYQTICEQEPDIVITDIRMPGLDGIELVEKVQKIRKDTYFVIISGYSQFEYARQAVRLGVEDYLLKPIKRKELELVLNKIKNKHIKNHEARSEKEILKTELQNKKEQMRNNLLVEMLMNPSGEITSMTKAELEHRYGCSLQGKYFYFLSVRFFENMIESDRDEYCFILNKIQKTLKERLAPYCIELLSVVHGKDVVCLLNTDKLWKEDLYYQLKKANVDIFNIREIYPKAQIAYAVSIRLENLQTYRETLKRLNMAFLGRFTQDNVYMFFENDVINKTNVVSEILTSEEKKNLLSAIELLDEIKVADFVRKTTEKMEKCRDEGRIIRNCYKELVTLFLIGIGNYPNMEQKPSEDYYMMGMETFYHLKNMMEWLEKEFCTLIVNYKQAQKDAEIRPVRLAKQYIREHYGETMNLEVVSKSVGFNPAYFSSVFKKTTGQNFMDYVTEVRMENAKILLRRTERDIADIAENVGYTDIKYFSKVFKKSTNLTPSEFRRLYG